MYVYLAFLLAIPVAALLDHLANLHVERGMAKQIAPGGVWRRYGCCHTCFKIQRKLKGAVHVHETEAVHVGSFHTIPAYALAWYCRECAPTAELIEAMTGYDLESLEAERNSWLYSTEKASWTPKRSWIPKE